MLCNPQCVWYDFFSFSLEFMKQKSRVSNTDNYK